ncbi:MAG: TIGR03905 family TSCPD domain-containing protein [Clostridiales bacterium]|nr:TIGR03905 family TSCPD domain-containing protein [Clostridiales bacterium]
MIMHYTFSPRGVCSTKIDFDIEDNVVSNVKFTGGCNGNLKAIGLLVEGKDASEIADLLEGNDCNGRGTSCADQFSKALKQALSQS